MNGKLAKEIRKEARRRFKTDMDVFVDAVMDLPLWPRIKFCFEILFGFIWRKKKGGDSK